MAGRDVASEGLGGVADAAVVVVGCVIGVVTVVAIVAAVEAVVDATVVAAVVVAAAAVWWAWMARRY